MFKPLLGLVLLTILFSGCQLMMKNQPPTGLNTQAFADHCRFDSGDAPVKGIIHNQAFQVEESSIRDGILELRQGKDFFADRKISVFLFLKEKGTVPSGKSFINSNNADQFGNPHVHVSWKENGKDFPSTDTMSGGYDMALTFGEAKGKQIPGKIAVCLPGDKRTILSGTFTADIKGFLLKPDGTPDLAQDDFENFRYLVRQDLQKTHGGKKVEIVETTEGQFSMPDPKGKYTQTGSLKVTFKVDEQSPQMTRYEFIKEPDEWKISKS